MKKQFTILLSISLRLFILLLMFSCSAQHEESLEPILEEINISDCSYSFIDGTDTVKSDLKFLASTQIFNAEEKQGVLSVFFEVLYNGRDYNLNFHTESNIFDNYLGLESNNLVDHEFFIELYFEGSSDPIIGHVHGVDLLDSTTHVKNDTFIGYTFAIKNISQPLLTRLEGARLVKFKIYDDMIGLYSRYRKDISKEIKCLRLAKK